MIGAHVIGGTVANLIVLPDGGYTPRSGTVVELTDGERCGIGWSFDPEGLPRFVDPTPAPEPDAETDQEGQDNAG